MVTSDQLFRFVKDVTEKVQVDSAGFVELGDGLTAIAKLAEAELFIAAQERAEKRHAARHEAQLQQMGKDFGGGPLAN